MERRRKESAYGDYYLAGWAVAKRRTAACAENRKSKEMASVLLYQTLADWLVVATDWAP